MRHRNLTIGVFTLLVLFQILFLLQVQGQNCYKRLSDASGVVPTQAQLDELENASCRLRDSLPEGFRDSFKVIDFGFYLHNENMVGGYPEAFQRAISEVESQSSGKYYLLFGKQTDKTGICTKFWVALKLPNQDIFYCIDQLSPNLRTDLTPINIAFSKDEIKIIEALNPTLEGKTQIQKNPHPEKTLAFAVWVGGKATRKVKDLLDLLPFLMACNDYKITWIST